MTKDNEPNYYEAGLKSKAFNDFNEKDDQDDCLMLLKDAISEKINHLISVSGVSYDGKCTFSIYTNESGKVGELRNFIDYLSKDNHIEKLVSYYIEQNSRRGFTQLVKDVYDQYELNKDITSRYNDLNRKLYRSGNEKQVPKKIKI
jgi:hypothetical protein